MSTMAEPAHRSLRPAVSSGRTSQIRSPPFTRGKAAAARTRAKNPDKQQKQ